MKSSGQLSYDCRSRRKRRDPQGYAAQARHIGSHCPLSAIASKGEESDMKKRKQHYVWKHYLKSWANNSDQIWCKRENSIFSTNGDNVACRRDFYRLKELTQHEIDMIKILAIDRSPEILKKLHLEFLNLFTMPVEYKKVFEKVSHLVPDMDNEFDILYNNYEEDYHCEIENSGIKYLDLILSSNIEFYNFEDERFNFLIYLTTQYTRTNMLKNSVMKATKNTNLVDIERIWNILSHIFATNIAYVLAGKQDFKLYLMNNNTNTKFITGDQPVINIHALDKG